MRHVVGDAEGTLTVQHIQKSFGLWRILVLWIIVRSLRFGSRAPVAATTAQVQQRHGQARREQVEVVVVPRQDDCALQQNLHCGRESLHGRDGHQDAAAPPDV